VIEVRMDGAFFSDTTIRRLETLGVEFTISVPFARFAALKELVENRQRWQTLGDRWSFFETAWKPKSWRRRHRFVCIRQRCRRSEEHTSELQSRENLVCRLLLEKKKKQT